MRKLTLVIMFSGNTLQPLISHLADLLGSLELQGCEFWSELKPPSFPSLWELHHRQNFMTPPSHTMVTSRLALVMAPSQHIMQALELFIVTVFGLHLERELSSEVENRTEYLRKSMLPAAWWREFSNLLRIMAERCVLHSVDQQ